MSSKKPSKSKKEEALAFLDDLDKFEPTAGSGATATSAAAAASNPSVQSSPSRGGPSSKSPRPDRPGTPSSKAKQSMDVPRGGDATTAAGAGGARVSTSSTSAQEDKDASEALAFLEAQIEKGKTTKRTGGALTGTKTSTASTAGARTPTVLAAPTATRKSMESSSRPATPVNSESKPAAASGWGSGWWSAASAAVQQAQKVADEGYKRIQETASHAVTASNEQGAEGAATREIKLPAVPGLGQLSDLVGKRNLEGLKGSLDQLRTAGAGALKGVDLEKLRQDIVQRGQAAVTDILNVVAPPISEHEVVQVWLSHDMKGYDGVEGVVYRAVSKIMEQTSSSDLEVFYSAPPRAADAKEGSESEDEERSINPVEGWEEAQSKTEKMLKEIVERAATDPRKGQPHPDVPVTTIPIYLHLQPTLVPLPYKFPTSTTNKASSKAPQADTHLAFIVALEDPTHSLSRSTVTQFCPGDWLDVEYERSDWVEERLVEVINNGVEVILQEYVATRMGLKGGAVFDADEESTTEGAKEKASSTSGSAPEASGAASVAATSTTKA